jgi:transposase-like protein
MADDGEPLDGPVEMDETYVGGKRRAQAPWSGNRGGGRPRADSHKTPVFGIVQRGRGTGQVVAMVVPDATTKTLMGHATNRVLPASLIYTDEWKPYENLPNAGYTHRRIHHASKVYVSGDVHTNTIEGFLIVLVRPGRDEFYAQPDYVARGPGVTAEATHWLFDRGVRVMGIDAWGWDAPLHLQAQEALERDEPGVFWAAHQTDLPYSQIERLCNLGALPPHGFVVSCFPLKIVGGSAAPARVVAILPD